jgi:hypothetical protein
MGYNQHHPQSLFCQIITAFGLCFLYSLTLTSDAAEKGGWEGWFDPAPHADVLPLCVDDAAELQLHACETPSSRSTLLPPPPPLPLLLLQPPPPQLLISLLCSAWANGTVLARTLMSTTSAICT